MTELDFWILDWIQAHLQNGFLDTVVPWVTMLGEVGAIWILLALALLVRKKTRSLGIMVALALVIDLLLCNILIKNIVARPRPFALREVALLVPPPSEFSFPSGHAAASFAAVGALYFGRNKLWVPAAILALLIGLSRLYLYVHYPSDVFCGALLGIFCGFLAVKFARKWIRICKNPEK